jgi:hypothetical protein
MERSEQVRANAQMVVQQLRPLSKIAFGYNRESVHWLEGYIERQRLQENFASRKDKFTSIFGSFLGECIIQCYGGHWEDSNGSLGVIFDGENAAFPFNKVRKQLDNGLEDGIGSFFDTIPILFKLSAKPQTPQRKPWWKIW